MDDEKENADVRCAGDAAGEGAGMRACGDAAGSNDMPGGAAEEGAARGHVISRRRFAEICAAGFVVTLSAGALSGCAGLKATADAALRGTRTVTDDTPRESITVPTADNIHKVFFTSALAEVYICCLCPDLMGGTATKFDSHNLPFLPDGVEKLPYLGTLHENAQIDRESLLTEGIDIIFSISGVANTEYNVSEAIDLQEQTNIPTLLVDGSFTKIPDAFRYLGDILGRQARAEELASFCERSYASVRDAVAAIPESDRITVYYAEGPEGLQTEPETSEHMLGFLEGGALCAAKCEETYGGGMTDVSLEQVLKWDPEVIVAWDEETRGGAAESIKTDRSWQQIKAVKDGRVYAMPNEPWAWCDRPPGVNRIIGIHWIANMLYPEAYDVDMVQIAKEYFQVMYQKDIDEQTFVDMLGSSYPPTKRVEG